MPGPVLTPKGFNGSDPLKQYLESTLSSYEFISRVTAGTVIGTVLVVYNSGNDHRSIARLIRKVIRESQRLPAHSREETPQ